MPAAHGADLLVVGSRGHAALAGRLLWSVSEHIAARATRRVVVIRRTPGPTTPRRPPQIAGSGREVMSGAGFPMRLSPHEQQILDEIQRCVQAEDPTFFVSMAGSRVRRRSVWGSVMFLLGLAAFLFGAVMAPALPGVGVGVSVAGFLAMFCGVWLLCSGDRAFHPHEQHGAALWRRSVEFWADLDGPPSTGPSG